MDFPSQTYISFRFFLQRTPSWGYKQKNGNFDGMIGALVNRETDVGGSSIFFRQERHEGEHKNLNKHFLVTPSVPWIIFLCDLLNLNDMQTTMNFKFTLIFPQLCHTPARHGRKGLASYFSSLITQQLSAQPFSFPSRSRCGLF